MKVVKISIILVQILSMAMVAACSGITLPKIQAQSVAATVTPLPSLLSTSYAEAPGTATQLALGTILLDGTAQAINKEQAAQLLPLWKMLRLLGKSDTAAVEEVNGTIYQIEKTMQPDQVREIAGMQITFQKAAGVLREKGFSFGSGFGGGAGAGSRGTPDPARLATRQAARQGFEGGSGGFGGGFGSGSTQSGAQNFSSRRSSTGINPALVELVIKYLQAK